MQTQLFAHRGAKAIAPENTLPAFRAALEMGADGIELDVHCSRDGQLVVIHDETLERTTDGRGPVSGMTAAELARLDAGSHFDSRFAGTGVPTLVEVLELINGRCTLNVEVKSRSRSGGDQVRPLQALIQAHGLYQQLLVSSFNPITLFRLKWMDPRVRLGLLYHQGAPWYLRHGRISALLRPAALHPQHTLVDAATMARARARSCAVNTWTVNDPTEARRLAGLGVDVIISDVPDQIRAALRPQSRDTKCSVRYHA